MKKTSQKGIDLKVEFGRNKVIPLKYEKVILRALAHYPELKDVSIEFRLMNKSVAPYGSKPTFNSFFRRPEKRTYIVGILEKAKFPTNEALLKNLPENAQEGAIGHELAHIVQFHSRNSLRLIRMALLYTIPKIKKRIERSADLRTINHGLGKQLREHALFIRKIPGYVEKRKEINRNYLKPYEIAELLRKDRAPGAKKITRKKRKSQRSPR
ncbi:MAG TPA: M48 family metalloprotease [Bacteroidia bacterium]|nr:M48 family metalloprotease [Bacteroidia bacterium]